MNFAMPPWLASHLICELYHAIIFLLRVKFVKKFSTFNYSSCASAIWHGHGKIWSGNKVFSADNAICRSACLAWLPIAPQRRIQRQMTSHIPPPRGARPNLAGLCCSYRAYGILHCYVICLV